MRGGARRTCGERGGGGRVRPVCALTAFCCDGRKLCGIGSELRNLEWNRGRAFELLLEREVATTDVAFTSPAKCGEGLLPRVRVRSGERCGSLEERQRLCGDTVGFLPRAARGAGNHGDETRGDGDRQRGGGPASGRLLAIRKATEEVVNPQLEIVVGVQSRTSVRRSEKAEREFVPT
jgi:hypothetical protein